MDTGVIARFAQGLLDKRQKLTAWLDTAPEEEKQVRLGPQNETAVQDHLHRLEQAEAQARSNTLGLCDVCHDFVDPELLEMDYTACVCLSHLSTEEAEHLQYDLELSQVVQRAMLPQKMPSIPGLGLAAFSRPAAIIGGDFFDFFQLHNGAYGFLIADVAGKGVPASLIMASVQSAIRALALVSETPVQVLEQLNHMFAHNIHFTTFVTLFLGAYDPASGWLTYCNAGHNPPLLYHPDRSAVSAAAWLRPTGAAIGLVEEPLFGQERVQLSAGDILLLYTDGVTEAHNAQYEQYGGQRIADLVSRNAGLTSVDLIRTLRSELEAFTGGQPLMDDTTIIACRVG